MVDTHVQGLGLFRGLLLAQAGTALTVAALVWLMAATPVSLAALWGGGICVLAHAWAGFQVWLHPGNRQPARMATSGLRAEIGKIIITLALLWVTLREFPAMQTRAMAAALMVGFFVTHAAGLVWLARNSGRFIQTDSSGGNDSTKQLD